MKKPFVDTRGVATRQAIRPPRKTDAHLEFDLHDVSPGIWEISGSAQNDGERIHANTRADAYAAAAAIVAGVPPVYDPASPEFSEAPGPSLPRAAKPTAAAAPSRRRAPRPAPMSIKNCLLPFGRLRTKAKPTQQLNHRRPLYRVARSALRFVHQCL